MLVLRALKEPKGTATKATWKNGNREGRRVLSVAKKRRGRKGSLLEAERTRPRSPLLRRLILGSTSGESVCTVCCTTHKALPPSQDTGDVPNLKNSYTNTTVV